jgi:hypothetical protein
MNGLSSNGRISLEVLSVASPCEAPWESMAGDERSRYCDHCQKQVHNLSAMPREEAERLVCEAAGSLCVRYARDESGRVMTLDYEPLPRRRKRQWWVASLSAGGVAAAIAAALWGWASPKPKSPTMVLGGIRPPATRAAVLGKVSAGSAVCNVVTGEMTAVRAPQSPAISTEDATESP